MMIKETSTSLCKYAEIVLEGFAFEYYPNGYFRFQTIDRPTARFYNEAL